MTRADVILQTHELGIGATDFERIAIGTTMVQTVREPTHHELVRRAAITLGLLLAPKTTTDHVDASISRSTETWSETPLEDQFHAAFGDMLKSGTQSDIEYRRALVAFAAGASAAIRLLFKEYPSAGAETRQVMTAALVAEIERIISRVLKKSAARNSFLSAQPFAFGFGSLAAGGLRA